jgi:hypothetical protein
MLRVGFEATTQVFERVKAFHVLARAATLIGPTIVFAVKHWKHSLLSDHLSQTINARICDNCTLLQLKITHHKYCFRFIYRKNIITLIIGPSGISEITDGATRSHNAGQWSCILEDNVFLFSLSLSLSFFVCRAVNLGITSFYMPLVWTKTDREPSLESVCSAKKKNNSHILIYWADPLLPNGVNILQSAVNLSGHKLGVELGPISWNWLFSRTAWVLLSARFLLDCPVTISLFGWSYSAWWYGGDANIHTSSRVHPRILASFLFFLFVCFLALSFPVLLESL